MKLYNEKEIGVILKRAAEMSQDESGPNAAGLSIEELKQVGAEAGLDPDLIIRVAAEMQQGSTRQKRNVLVGPTNYSNDFVLEGEVDAATWEEMLAAGNESQNTANVSPASAEGNNIYTICATTSTDGWASYSNYGSEVDYCEPGSGIESTWKDGGYNTISGTSMATPHAAGILLLGAIRNGGTVNGPDRQYTIGIH